MAGQRPPTASDGFGLSTATATFLAVNLVLLAFFVVMVARSTFTPESATDATLSVTAAFGTVPVRIADQPARAADPDFAAAALTVLKPLQASLAEQRRSAADLALPADALFLKGSDAITPAGADALAALVALLQDQPSGLVRALRLSVPELDDRVLAERRAIALDARLAQAFGGRGRTASGVAGGGVVLVTVLSEPAS